MKNKKLLVLIPIITLSTFTHGKMTKDNAIEEICGSISEYSESVMQSRQLGGKMVDSIKLINQSGAAEPIKNFHKSIVFEAYKEPKWATEKNQKNAVTEFSNKMYLVCNESFRNELKDLD
ncbi:hypothetical protein [uncultured Acinetobacter sp.]|uniref:hypothetical protein n=1 Tax=uncultured Acinetobacter sp. TaxID=165433 RepID=UPI0026291994|nr:hypothetical protein [uncultured Acinetobacter sp.]